MKQTNIFFTLSCIIILLLAITSCSMAQSYYPGSVQSISYSRDLVAGNSISTSVGTTSGSLSSLDTDNGTSLTFNVSGSSTVHNSIIVYSLPAGVSESDLSQIDLVLVDYLGEGTNMDQITKFQILNDDSSSYETMIDTNVDNCPDWVEWDKTASKTSSLGDYVNSSGKMKIRVLTTTADYKDNFTVDSLVVSVTYTTGTPTPGGGSDYYVSTIGSDSNNGTSTNDAWLTIDHAVDNVSAGSTIHVAPGTYVGRVSFDRSGSLDSPIILDGDGTSGAVISGSGLTVASGWDPLVDINGKSYITIKDMRITDFTSSSNNCSPVGLFIRNTATNSQSTNITIDNVQFDTIQQTYWNGNNNNQGGSVGNDAHALAVYGTQGTGYDINNITIKNSTFFDNLTGSSEVLVINGNVDNWDVIENTIYNNNNIAIDIIGHEGKAPSSDQARNGGIYGNTVYNISTNRTPGYENKAYTSSVETGGYDLCAGAIYIDGGTNVIVEGNYTYSSDIGIEIASEWPGKVTDYITVRSNFVYNNGQCGIAIGGYDSGRGNAKYIKVLNNTMYKNGTFEWDMGELCVQFYVSNSVFKNNIMFAKTQSDGTAFFITSAGGTPTSSNVDYNLYYSNESPSIKTWQWGPTTKTSLSSWKSLSDVGTGEVETNPSLVSTSTPDLHIQSGSNAKDAGTNEADRGTYDYDGQSRTVNSKVDIGADELQ